MSTSPNGTSPQAPVGVKERRLGGRLRRPGLCGDRRPEGRSLGQCACPSLLTLWIRCLQAMLDKVRTRIGFPRRSSGCWPPGPPWALSCSLAVASGFVGLRRPVPVAGWCWPAPCSCHWCSCSKKAHNRSRRGRPWRINVRFDFVDVRAPFRPSTARGRWRSSQPGSAGAAPTPQ